MSTLPSSTADQTDFPRSWRWDQDGLHVDGTFVQMDEGPTEYGRKPILVLDVGSERRSIWLTQEALVGRFRDELERRRAPNFTAGERIIVTRGSEKKESQAGRSYWPFKVSFPDAPRPSDADMLSAEPASEP